MAKSQADADVPAAVGLSGPSSSHRIANTPHKAEMIGTQEGRGLTLPSPTFLLFPPSNP